MPRSWSVPRRQPLRGSVTVPGDKSISHRALLLNALGEGQARLRGLNPGADVESTRAALRALGVQIVARDGDLVLTGRRGNLRPASDRIDCGNSGTTVRLLAGILAAQPFTTTLDGDASLRARPMERIAQPLRTLGARVEGPTNGQRCPLIVTGGALRPGRFELPVASAQVKSCLLLAGQVAGVEVEVHEPGNSRDHTERMLTAMGGAIETRSGYARVRPAALHCLDIDVPGDPSAAALVGAAAAVLPGSEVTFPNLLLNATRLGFLNVLERMGVAVGRGAPRTVGGEPVGDLRLAAPERLRACAIGPDGIPGLVDEIPALAVVAAFASGTSRFEGIAELRVKESDRIAAVQELLEASAIVTRSGPDWLEIDGGTPQRRPQLEPAPDHRMVMAACALALGAAGDAGVVVGMEHAAVSYPGFAADLERLSR